MCVCVYVCVFFVYVWLMCVCVCEVGRCSRNGRNEFFPLLSPNSVSPSHTHVTLTTHHTTHHIIGVYDEGLVLTSPTSIPRDETPRDIRITLINTFTHSLPHPHIPPLLCVLMCFMCIYLFNVCVLCVLCV